MIQKSQQISLTAVPGMGPRRIRALFRKYPDLDDISCISKSDLMQVEGILCDLAGKTQNIDLDIGKQAIEKTAALGARYLTYWDREYPEILKMIYDAPVGIFISGGIPSLPCLTKLILQNQMAQIGSFSRVRNWF